jgi:hypothetical protein
MKRLVALAMVAAIAAPALPTLAIAQGTTQTITAVDVKVVSTGYRASKIIGSDVVNDKNESIGKVDDIIISKDGHNLFAVISVGGFLGIGSKLVAIKYEELRPTTDNRGLVLPGATKDSLTQLPEFRYAQ